MASQPQPRRFKLTRTPFTRHYDIKVDNGTDAKSTPNAYVVDISSLTPNKPDVTLHEGDDMKTAPVVAVCHIPKGSRNEYKLGVGDPNRDPSGVIWEGMQRTGIKGSEIPWEFPVAARGGRVKLVWKRTTHVAADGMKPGKNTRNYKLVEAGSDEVIAVFTRQFGFTSCGTFQINVDWGRDFEHAVLMSSVALYEKKRRQNARAAAAHGGG